MNTGSTLCTARYVLWRGAHVTMATYYAHTSCFDSRHPPQHSKGLQELRIRTMCKITIPSEREGGKRKILLRCFPDGNYSARDPKKAIVGAFQAIAELWQAGGAGSVAARRKLDVKPPTRRVLAETASNSTGAAAGDQADAATHEAMHEATRCLLTASRDGTLKLTNLVCMLRDIETSYHETLRFAGGAKKFFMARDDLYKLSLPEGAGLGSEVIELHVRTDAKAMRTPPHTLQTSARTKPEKPSSAPQLNAVAPGTYATLITGVSEEKLQQRRARFASPSGSVVAATTPASPLVRASSGDMKPRQEVPASASSSSKSAVCKSSPSQISMVQHDQQVSAITSSPGSTPAPMLALAHTARPAAVVVESIPRFADAAMTPTQPTVATVVPIDAPEAPMPSKKTARLAAWLQTTCKIDDKAACNTYAAALVEDGCDTVDDLRFVDEWEVYVPKRIHRKKILEHMQPTDAPPSSGSGSSGSTSGDSGSGSGNGDGDSTLGDCSSGLSDAAQVKIAALEQDKKELAEQLVIEQKLHEQQNQEHAEQLSIQERLYEQQEQARADAAPRLDAAMFKKNELSFRHEIQQIRDNAGKNAETKWPNFIVRRALHVPAIKLTDIGKQLDIDECSIQFKTKGNVLASKHRLVDWGVNQPQEVKGAEIIAVDGEIGGDVVIETKGTQVTFSNPSGGLVLDVLGFMMFGSKGDRMSRQDFFRPTGVTFEGEEGMDIAGAGGLSQDMHASFWLGVIHEDMRLFEVRDTALPSAGADTERLECVGQFLAKSIIDEKPIGRGLSRFVFEFLIDETSRTFDTSKPIDQQARVALSALQDFDAELARQYSEVLHGDLVEGAHIIGEFAPNRDDADLPVTKHNRAEVIVSGCKYLLWEYREDALLALRTGFSTREVCCKQPIDLRLPLQRFFTADLQLLVQGQDAGVSTADLISSIEWPREGMLTVYEAGFPHQSNTIALLREIMDDEEVFNTQRRAAFLQWATARHVLPAGGLDATSNGKIKLRCNRDAASGYDEARWGLPTVKTCVAELWLPSFSRREVLQGKLLLAIDNCGSGFTRGD